MYMADQCRRMEIHGLNANQARIAIEWMQDLDQTGISVLDMEYTPAADNSQLGQNVLRINVAGPDIAAFVIRVRDQTQTSLGRPLDLDVSKTADLTAIKNAYQTYGTDIENREALHTALIDIWKNGARCMSGDDSRKLKKWLADRGFSNRQQLVAWLQQRP